MNARWLNSLEQKSEEKVWIKVLPEGLLEEEHGPDGPRETVLGADSSRHV